MAPHCGSSQRTPPSLADCPYPSQGFCTKLFNKLSSVAFCSVPCVSCQNSEKPCTFITCESSAQYWIRHSSHKHYHAMYLALCWLLGYNRK